MRTPGWVWLLLVVGACDKDAAAQAEPSSAAAHEVASAPRVSPFVIEELKRCAAADLESGGAVSYVVEVGLDGRVASVKALPSTVSPAVLNCSLQKIRAWQFAARKHQTLEFSVDYGVKSAAPPTTAAPAPGSKAALENTIKQRTLDLKDCLHEGLRVSPLIHGRVDYRIFIAVSGEVTDVEAEGAATIPQAVIHCSKAKILAWTFPMDGAVEAADVRFSVVFKPRDAPPTDTRP